MYTVLFTKTTGLIVTLQLEYTTIYQKNIETLATIEVQMYSV